MELELGFTWQVPLGWQEIDELALGQQANVVYQQAWANREDAVRQLAEGIPHLQDSLMVLTAQVSNETDSPFPPPGSRLVKTPLGQEVAEREVGGTEANPFALRLSHVMARTPYHYTLELSCLFPVTIDDPAWAVFDAECRDMWHYLSFDFGLCPLPSTPVPVPVSWQTVSDEYYGYVLEVPLEWQREEHPTADKLTFLTDLGIISQPRACRLPNGLMEFNLTVNPSGNFLPADGPDRTEYESLPDRPFPTWIRHFDETEVGIEGMGIEGVTATNVHIQGPEYWYSLGFQCHAPSGSNDETQADFQAQCDVILAHILDSFQIH